VDGPVVAAVVSSVSAICVAGASAGFGVWSQRQNDRRLEALEKQQREDDAWRTYTFDARTRLYKELGPLLFSLVEACDELQWRVRGIAGRAAEGPDDGDDRRFKPGSDYMLSTLYRLMAPVAITRLVQDRLTLVDLAVDPAVDRIYSLAKLMRRTWNAGPDLARWRGLPYRPVHDGRTPETAKQHVNLRAVDRLAEQLVPASQRAGDGTLLRYSSFLENYQGDGAADRPAAEPFERLFDRFHPDRRPVLWQLLCTEALLAASIVRNAARGGGGWGTAGDPLAELPDKIANRGSSPPDHSDADGSLTVSAAARHYARARLPESLFDGAQEGSRPAIPSPRSNAEAVAGTGTSGPYQPPSRPI
jgi:hypothetical protein